MSADVLHSIGCDYLTLTGIDTNLPGELHRRASSIFREQSERGNRTRGFGMAGFSGFQCGGVQIGKRDEELLVRLSSDVAAMYWSTLGPLATNCTRIDLQATILPAEGPARRLSKNRKSALRNAMKANDKRIVRWVADNRGGFTLYLGARQSNVFGRAYDKFAESSNEHFRGALRYEVEFKGKLAYFILRSLLNKPYARTTVASYVSQFFGRRGVQLELSADNAATYCCSRSPADAEKTLKWLQEAVRPSVLRLIAQNRGDEVLMALGLVVQSNADETMLDQEDTIH
jgi:hypothetical protein